MAELLLEHVEIDAHTERFDEAGPATDDLEDTVSGVEATDVAGGQLRERRTEREVGVVVRIAEHHVRPAVDELADVVGQAVDWTQHEASPGDRQADRRPGRRVRSPAGGTPCAAVASVCPYMT